MTIPHEPAEPAVPATADPVAAPPTGWQRHTRRSPLTQPWEPLFACIDPGAQPEPANAALAAQGHGPGALQRREPSVALGLRVAEPHCNARGFAHGGLISALADNAMGLSAVAAAQAGAQRLGRQGPTSALTVSLALDFVDSARIGQWLAVRPVVLRHGGTLAFAECHVTADDRLVARGNATFRLVLRPDPAGGAEPG